MQWTLSTRAYCCGSEADGPSLNQQHRLRHVRVDECFNRQPFPFRAKSKTLAFVASRRVSAWRPGVNEEGARKEAGAWAGLFT